MIRDNKRLQTECSSFDEKRKYKRHASLCKLQWAWIASIPLSYCVCGLAGDISQICIALCVQRPAATAGRRTHYDTNNKPLTSIPTLRVGFNSFMQLLQN